MKRLLSVVLLLVLAISIFAAPFNKTISVSGGSARRLSTVLQDGGYSGTSSLDELTICNPSAGTLYIGQSNVNASNGFPLATGDCITWRRATVPIDVTAVWLFVASTQNESFSLR